MKRKEKLPTYNSQLVLRKSSLVNRVATPTTATTRNVISMDVDGEAEEEYEVSSKDSDEEEVEMINDVENTDGLDSSSRPILFDDTDNYGDYSGYDPGIPYDLSTSPYLHHTTFPSSSFFSPSPSLSTTALSQSPPPPYRYKNYNVDTTPTAPSPSPYAKPPPASPPFTSATSPPDTSPRHAPNNDEPSLHAAPWPTTPSSPFLHHAFAPPSTSTPTTQLLQQQHFHQFSAPTTQPVQQDTPLSQQRPRPKRSQSVMASHNNNNNRSGYDSGPHAFVEASYYSTSQPASPVRRMTSNSNYPTRRLRRSNSSSNLEQVAQLPEQPPTPSPSSQPPRLKPYHNLMVRQSISI